MELLFEIVWLESCTAARRTMLILQPIFSYACYVDKAFPRSYNSMRIQDSGQLSATDF